MRGNMRKNFAAVKNELLRNPASSASRPARPCRPTAIRSPTASGPGRARPPTSEILIRAGCVDEGYFDVLGVEMPKVGRSTANRSRRKSRVHHQRGSGPGHEDEGAGGAVARRPQRQIQGHDRRGGQGLPLHAAPPEDRATDPHLLSSGLQPAPGPAQARRRLPDDRRDRGRLEEDSRPVSPSASISSTRPWTTSTGPEERIGTIIRSFSFLAVVVSCLGLFGLASFTAERRTKEIGIRKVLGATGPNIVWLFSEGILPMGPCGQRHRLAGGLRRRLQVARRLSLQDQHRTGAVSLRRGAGSPGRRPDRRLSFHPVGPGQSGRRPALRVKGRPRPFPYFLVLFPISEIVRRR